MKNARILLGCYISVLLILWPNLPGAEINSPSPLSLSDFLPKTIHDNWFQYRFFWERKEYEAAQESLDRLKKQATDLGIDNLDTLSAVLLQDANILFNNGNVTLALTVARNAQELSPNYPASYFIRGHFLLKSQPWKILEIVGEYLNGWVQSSQHIWMLLYGLSNGLVWLFWSGGATLLIFLLAVGVRYAPRMNHLFYELGKRQIPRKILYFLTVMILTGPIWLGLGIAWLPIGFLFLLWFFMKGWEKGISVIFIILMSSMGYGLTVWMSILKASERGPFVVMAGSVRGEVTVPPEITVNSGTERMETDLPDWQVLMSQGLQYKRTVQYDLARQYFEEAIEAKPDEARIFVNLGNVFFLINRFEEAIEVYQRALQRNPNSVEAHYNLAQAYRENLLFDEGEREYKEAQRLNMTQTERYTSRALNALSHPVVDAPLTLMETLKRGIKVTDEVRLSSNSVIVSLWNVSPATLPFLGVGLAGVLLFLSWVIDAKGLPFPCSLCGRTICPRCQRHIFHLRICEDCLEGNKKVKRLLELRQVQDLHERQLRRAKLLSLVIPGLGHFSLLQSIKGFLFAFVFSSLIFWGFLQDVQFFAPYAWILPGFDLSFFAPLGGLLLLYFVLFWDLSRIQVEWET